MGFLSPLLLVLGLGVGVPLILHLLRHGERVKIIFPAFQYLHRTEREHARKIRARQLLLLLLRCAIVLVAALAAARPFLPRGNDSHQPTAVAIIIDNSLTSGRVIGERRVLDTLIAAGLAVTERAGPDDRFWVIRAGEPWELAVPGSADGAAATLLATEPVDGAADLTEAVRRARDLVQTAGLGASEVHLLTDLQATGFVDQNASVPSDSDTHPPPVLVFAPTLPVAENRGVTGLVVNGGLAPLVGEPVQLSAVIHGDSDSEGGPVAVRLIIDGEVRSVLRVQPPATATFEVPIGIQGTRVQGMIELDPDALRADDRAFFAVQLREPPSIRAPRASPFVEAALDVLSDAGRISQVQGDADVVFLEAGDALAPRLEGRVIVIIPPADATLLPALNRRIDQLGLGVRLSAPLRVPGLAIQFEAPIVSPDTVRVWSRFPIESTDPNSSPLPLARTEDGEAWAVQGTVGMDRWIVFGSTFSPEATSLPISATLYSVLEWLVAGAGFVSGTSSIEAGSPLGTAPGATSVHAPDGTETAVNGTRLFRPTAQAGIYEIRRGDSIMAVMAVNPPFRESELRPLEAGQLGPRLGDPVQWLDDLPAWSRTVFLVRRGKELSAWLLVILFMALIAESLLASSGGRANTGTQREGNTATPTTATAREALHR